MTPNPSIHDAFDSLEIVIANLKLMESCVFGLKQFQQFVGKGPTSDMLDSLIHEAELGIAELKRRVIN